MNVPRVALIVILLLTNVLTARAQSVTLGWDASPEPDISGYVVNIGESPGVYTQQMNVGAATTLVFTIPDASKTYFFSVQAYSRAGLISGHSMELTYVPTNPSVPRPPTGFDKNGTTNILWQHNDGWLGLWHMNGTRLAYGEFFTPNRLTDLDWQVISSADMNGDGDLDLLLRHRTAGYIVAWMMKGKTLVDSIYLHPGQVEDLRWKIAGTGDFDADGRPDLLWQHDDGWIASWLMDGRVMRSAVRIAENPVATEWRIAGAGDFDSDGKSDILWQHREGWLGVWFMDGTTLRNGALLNPNFMAPGTWRIGGISDLNGDGHADILCHHVTGGLAVWLMRGTNVIAGQLLTPNWVDPAVWTLAGPR